MNMSDSFDQFGVNQSLVSYFPNQFFGLDFFAVSYSKPTLAGYFNSRILNPRPLHHELFNSIGVWGRGVHGWKVCDWEVRVLSLGLKSLGLECPVTHNKARLVKAEALFNVCQFEHAMVHFHRGMVSKVEIILERNLSLL